MAFYAVLTPPPDTTGGLDQAEQAVFVKDGFNVYAFLFTGFWLLSKRLWLAFLVFLAFWAAIAVGGRFLGLHPFAIALAQALIGLFLALEGSALIERKLTRKGWTLAGVVEGKRLDDIERRFFEQVQTRAAAVPQAPAAPSITPAAYPAPQPPQGVVGLFPDPHRRA